MSYSGMGNREADQMKFLQLQFENVKQENTRIDEQITTINHQCKQYQNQMEVWVLFLLLSKSCTSIFIATSSSTDST
jgi:hypothetical protein